MRYYPKIKYQLNQLNYQYFKSFLCFKYKGFTLTITLKNINEIFTNEEIKTLYNKNILYKIYYIDNNNIKYYFLKSNLYDYVLLNNYYIGDEEKIYKDLNIELIDITDEKNIINLLKLLVHFP